MKTFTIRLSNDEEKILSKLMRDTSIKTKSEAIRKCIRTSSETTRENDLLLDIDLKLNKILHSTTFSKNLLQQFFVNTGFATNIDLKKDHCLNEFYDQNYNYKDYFMN